MGSYSIKDLEKLSGVKAHTIRIWEQRYGLLEPERSITNIRTYDDEQLRRLLNVCVLMQSGIKVSKISKLSEGEINDTLLKLIESPEEDLRDHALQIKSNGLIISMIELDEDKFNAVFATSLLKRGFEETMVKLIYPFLERVGIMWGIGEINPAQEHFISNLIRQKVIVAIDTIPLSKEIGRKFLLFLSEGELHELGLLMANYILKQHNQQVFYLGQSVPLKDVESVSNICEPDVVLTFVTSTSSKEQSQQYVDSLSSKFPDKTIMLSGGSKCLDEISFPSNVVCLRSMEDLIDQL